MAYLLTIYIPKLHICEDRIVLDKFWETKLDASITKRTRFSNEWVIFKAQCCIRWIRLIAERRSSTGIGL